MLIMVGAILYSCVMTASRADESLREIDEMPTRKRAQQIYYVDRGGIERTMNLEMLRREYTEIRGYAPAAQMNAQDLVAAMNETLKASGGHGQYVAIG